jgi:hypothetical protein
MVILVLLISFKIYSCVLLRLILPELYWIIQEFSNQYMQPVSDIFKSHTEHLFKWISVPSILIKHLINTYLLKEVKRTYFLKSDDFFHFRSQKMCPTYLSREQSEHRSAFILSTLFKYISVDIIKVKFVICIISMSYNRKDWQYLAIFLAQAYIMGVQPTRGWLQQLYLIFLLIRPN